MIISLVVVVVVDIGREGGFDVNSILVKMLVVACRMLAEMGVAAVIGNVGSGRNEGLKFL